MPEEVLTPYQAQMVALAETGVTALVLGLTLLLCLVAIAVVRHI